MTALTGCGALLKFIITGESLSVLAWLAGAMFIPTLALIFGVLTASNKAFEIVYVVWMYIILQKVPTLDFIGFTMESPWMVYLLLAVALLVLSGLVRHLQLKSR